MAIEKSSIDLYSLQGEFERLNNICDYKFFFLLGMAKSGTTWCQQILNTHSQIICRGETNLNKRWARPLKSCIDRYNQNVKESGNDNVYFGDDQSEFFYICGILQMMGVWLEERSDDQIRFVGERTPNNMAARMRTWNKYFPESKFLHVIRDPRDVAVSACLFWKRRRPNNFNKRLANIEHYFDEFIKLWVRQIDDCRILSGTLPGRYFEFRYEDLINSSSTTLKSILNFIGASSAVEEVQNCIWQTSFENQTGRARGSEDFSGHKIRKGVIGDWVNHLDAENVLGKYGDLLNQYGY